MKQNHIGEIIKNNRLKKNISQGKLAKLLGVQNPVIYKYEHGIIKTIPFEKRIKLAKILDINIADLLYQNENIDVGEIMQRIEILKAQNRINDIQPLEQTLADIRKFDCQKAVFLEQTMKNLEINKTSMQEWFKEIEKLPANSHERKIALEAMYSFSAGIASFAKKLLEQQEEKN